MKLSQFDNQFDEREISTLLAALRLFQKEAEKFNMLEAFPDHFDDGTMTPLSSEEIDCLCEKILTNS